MKICIMTKGRMGRQETLKSIPELYIEDTKIVCPPGEYHGAYPDGSGDIHLYEPMPMNYSQKFQWLLYEALPDEKKLIIMDDDLYFSEYHGTKLVNLKPADDEDQASLTSMFLHIERLLDVYPLVGIHPRQMANNSTPPFEECSKIVTVQAINRDLLPRGIKTDYLPIMSDVILNCSLLMMGYKTARITTHFVDWLPSQASGGCDYRTPEMQKQAVEWIAGHFAPFAQIVVKKPKSAKWLGDERYDLKIRWKDMQKWGEQNARRHLVS